MKKYLSRWAPTILSSGCFIGAVAALTIGLVTAPTIPEQVKTSSPEGSSQIAGPNAYTVIEPVFDIYALTIEVGGIATTAIITAMFVKKALKEKDADTH